jgi:hypothetical protein
VDEILIKTNEKKLNENKYLLDLVTKFRSTNVNIIKTNLRKILKPMYKGHERFEGISGLSKFLEIEISELYSYMYISYTSNLKLETLLWICSMLKVSPFSLFKDIKVQEPVRKKWTSENKQEFVDYVCTYGIERSMDEFNLSRKSTMHYYNVFKRQIYRKKG